MADIEFNCPACDQVLEAPEEMAGEAIDCPSCETEITIPQTAGDAISIIPKLTLEEDRYTEPAGNVCPECDATLAEGAVLCVQCGFHLKLGKKISTDFD